MLSCAYARAVSDCALRCYCWAATSTKCAPRGNLNARTGCRCGAAGVCWKTRTGGKKKSSRSACGDEDGDGQEDSRKTRYLVRFSLLQLLQCSNGCGPCRSSRTCCACVLLCGVLRESCCRRVLTAFSLQKIVRDRARTSFRDPNKNWFSGALRWGITPPAERRVQRLLFFFFLNYHYYNHVIHS